MQEEKDHNIQGENQEKFIELKKVIASKSPKLARRMPGFVMRYLKKIIHQDRINYFLYKHQDKKDYDFAEAILKEFNIKVNIHNPENIPIEGRHIIAANHPLGGPDGVALVNVISKFRKDVVFPVNDLLMFLPNVRGLFAPINKHGRNTDTIRSFNAAFDSDKLVLYFPAGLVSRKQKGKIKDLEWKKTIISKARKTKRDVVPVYIDGKNSNFFYNLANLRKFLRIKTNIEMLYLVNEMTKQENKTINIIFGKAVSWEKFQDPREDRKWASEIKEMVYDLEARFSSENK